ncbi:minor capsid protein [Nostoc sp. CHAB 5836]|uniref:minor capsid protein n=1 Tax=Nostoc sp. CHAB 5836 TaxID=2780404 RepID=UPI001E326391|nr:minor capsid protein [Nostoc sp. CHAB 5836]MCC5616366.1 minor capsid protein [Nostoc sp. CHAB 5836]
MYDSVFSDFSATQFPNDKLILGEKKVLLDLDNIETRGVSLISKIPLEAAKRLNEDPDTVRQYILSSLSSSLYSIWLAGWNVGSNHADAEIKSQRDLGGFPHERLTVKQKTNFSQYSNLIYFDDGTQRKGVEVRSIRNIPAENAILGRINQLAQDVTNSEYKKIQQDLLAAVTPQPDTKQPISRNELLKRIERILGTKSGKYAKRAERIARTELTFAYNAGRLETYRESGLVSGVRFYTILDERRCEICASRHGLVIPLEDWKAIAANSPPVHVNCRCVLSPVLKKSPELKQPDRQVQNRELVPRPVLWAAAGILAAVLLGGKTKGVTKVIGQTTETVAGITLSQAIQQIRSDIGEKSSVTQPATEEQPEQVGQVVEQQITEAVPTPQVKLGQLDINTATREELQKILPSSLLTVRQVNAILRRREQSAIAKIDDLKNVPEIGVKTFERLKQLSEGYQIIPLLDPRSIRTPAQLWAANLGLTKSQAETVFNELQKGAFKDIEDLKTRLHGKGIGDRTIENMQQRAVVIQRQLPPVKENVPVREVGSMGAEGQRGRGAEEVGTTPTQSRAPLPYSSSGLPPETITPPRRQPTVTTDPLKQELSAIQSGVDDFSQASAKTASVQLSSKELFGKSLKQQVTDAQNTVDGFRSFNQQVATVEDQLTEWDRRLGSIEDNYQNLLDPTKPNYFEQAPQVLAQVRAQLQKAVKTIDGAVENNNKYAAKLNDKIDAIETRVNKLNTQRAASTSQRTADNLRTNLEQFNTKIQTLESQLTQLPPGAERSQAWLELQRLKQQQSDALNQIKTASDQLNDYINPVVDTARGTLNTIDNANSAITQTAEKLKQLYSRLDQLPVTKNQLDPELRTQYDTVKDLRTVQRRMQGSVRQYRRTDEAATRNLNNRATNQENFYNRYDDQYQRFEGSVTKSIERRLAQVQQDMQELESMPQGQVAWLLGFNGWDVANIPDDLALVLPSAPTSSKALAQIRKMSSDLWQKTKQIEANIEIVKRNSEFKFVNADRKLQDFDQLLKTAEDNLTFWQQQRNAALNPSNIGSSNNRLTELWREIQKAVEKKDNARLQELYRQISPDDAYGYARKTLLDMEEWSKRYQDVIGSTAKPGALAQQPITKLYNQYQQANEVFLQQLGNSRVKQSQAIEQAYQDAKDIYERLRYDANRVPTFDINGKATTAQELAESLQTTQERLKGLVNTRQFTNPAVSANPKVVKAQQQLDALNSTSQTTFKEINDLTQEIDQLKQLGKGTTKKEKLLAQKRQTFEETRQQMKALSEDVKDLKLGDEAYQQIQQLKASSEGLKSAIASNQSQLATVNQQLVKLQEQQQILGGGLSQRAIKMSDEIDSLQALRIALVKQIAESLKLVQSLQYQIQSLRNP